MSRSDRRDRAVSVDGGSLGVAKVYEYGRGWRIVVDESPDLAPLLCLGVSKSLDEIPVHAGRIAGVIRAARDAESVVEFWSLIAERNVWAGWPANRVDEVYAAARAARWVPGGVDLFG